MTQRLWPAALLLTTACASAPPAAPPAPAGSVIAYTVPSPATAKYAFADSSSFDIRGGAIGDIHVAITNTGNADIAFASKGTDVAATITITSLSGSMTNSAMGGGPTASEKDVTGAAVVTVTPRGAPTLSSMPQISKTATTVGIGESFYRRFFSRLPGSVVKRGAAWVDTVLVTDDNGGTKTTLNDIVTSTLAGDTTLNGRTLSKITTSTQRTLNVSGTNEGVEIAQKLTGATTGWVLWDPARKLVVERIETTHLSGTFDLPQMGMTGLPVTASGTGRLTLVQ